MLLLRTIRTLFSGRRGSGSCALPTARASEQAVLQSQPDVHASRKDTPQTASVPSTVDNIVQTAESALRNQDLLSAESILKLAMSSFPDNVRLMELRASCAERQGNRLEEAIWRARLFQQNPANPELGVRLVRAHMASAENPTLERNCLDSILALANSSAIGRAERIELCEFLYSFPSYREIAGSLLIASYATSEHQTALFHAQPAEWYCVDTGQSLVRPWPSVSHLGKPVHPLIARLHDIEIWPSLQWMPVDSKRGLILEDYASLRMRTRRELGISPLLASADEALLVRPPQQHITVREPCLLLGSSANYYHWLVDHLMRLAIAAATPDLGGSLGTRSLLVASPTPQFALEWLKLLRLDSCDARLLAVPMDTRITCHDLVAPGSPARFGCAVHPEAVSWLRRQVGVPTAPGRRRLLLSRRNQRRQIANEPELAGALAALRFEVVSPERLSIAEQLELFAGANIIVGASGAALANMMFMPPGGGIVCILDSMLAAQARYQYFDALAHASGHRFLRIAGTAVDCEAGPQGNQWVDPGAVLAAVESLIARTG